MNKFEKFKIKENAYPVRLIEENLVILRPF